MLVLVEPSLTVVVRAELHGEVVVIVPEAAADQVVHLARALLTAGELAFVEECLDRGPPCCGPLPGERARLSA